MLRDERSLDMSEIDTMLIRRVLPSQPGVLKIKILETDPVNVNAIHFPPALPDDAQPVRSSCDLDRQDARQVARYATIYAGPNASQWTKQCMRMEMFFKRPAGRTFTRPPDQRASGPLGLRHSPCTIICMQKHQKRRGGADKGVRSGNSGRGILSNDKARGAHECKPLGTASEVQRAAARRSGAPKFGA